MSTRASQTVDWDAVVMTHPTFIRWPLSPVVSTTALAAKVADLRAELTRLDDAENRAAETLTKRPGPASSRSPEA